MRVTLDPGMLHGPFVQDIQAISGQNLMDCYQCGRCSAGCPMVEDMDVLPNVVIRLAQLGLTEVMGSKTPWVCAACMTCQARCPKGVDLPRIMEALRQMATRTTLPHLLTTRIPDELLADAPQMAVVGALRKVGK